MCICILLKEQQKEILHHGQDFHKNEYNNVYDITMGVAAYPNIHSLLGVNMAFDTDGLLIRRVLFF